MTRNHTNRMLMVASSISIFASGCVTGTNTFSRVGESTAEYCELTPREEPVFDVVSTRYSDTKLPPNDDIVGDGQKVNLKP